MHTIPRTIIILLTVWIAVDSGMLDGRVLGWNSHSSTTAHSSQIIVGTVVDGQTQRPIKGALVEIRDHRSPQFKVFARGTTAANGSFDLMHSTQNGVFIVTAEGYATHRRGLSRVGEYPIVHLQRSARLSGRVKGLADGRAVSAVIRITSHDSFNVVDRTLRSVNGYFEIDGLLPVRTSLVVRARGFAPTSSELFLQPGRAVSIPDVELQPASALEGVVVWTDGSPAVGARVTIQYGDRLAEKGMLEALVGGRLTTKTDGVFRLDSVIPNVPLTIHASVAGRNARLGPLSVAPAEVRSSLQVTMER